MTLAALFKTALTTAAATFAAAWLAAGAQAADFQIRYAGVQGPDDANTKAQRMFKEEVEKASNGRIEVVVYFGQQMAGGNVNDQYRFMKLGALEMVATGPAQFSTDAIDYGAIAMPFLFSSLPEADKVLDGKAGTVLAASAEKIGIKLLGFQNQGMRNVITAKKPVRSLADLAGLKLRVVPGPVSLATYKALGANPIAMDYAEVPTAMTQGVIDGLDFPYTPTVGLKAYSYAKYYTLLQTSFETTIVAMNLAFFNKLPPDLQQVVLTAAKNSIAFQRKQQAEDETSAADIMKKNGMEIIALSDADLKLAREKVQGVYKEFEPRFNPELVKAIHEGQ